MTEICKEFLLKTVDGFLWRLLNELPFSSKSVLLWEEFEFCCRELRASSGYWIDVIVPLMPYASQSHGQPDQVENAAKCCVPDLFNSSPAAAVPNCPTGCYELTPSHPSFGDTWHCCDFEGKDGGIPPFHWIVPISTCISGPQSLSWHWPFSPMRHAPWYPRTQKLMRTKWRELEIFTSLLCTPSPKDPTPSESTLSPVSSEDTPSPASSEDIPIPVPSENTPAPSPQSPAPSHYSRLASKVLTLPFQLPSLCHPSMLHTKIWTPVN